MNTEKQTCEISEFCDELEWCEHTVVQFLEMLHTNCHNIVPLLSCRFVWSGKYHEKHSFFPEVLNAARILAYRSVKGTGGMAGIFHSLEPVAQISVLTMAKESDTPVDVYLND